MDHHSSVVVRLGDDGTGHAVPGACAHGDLEKQKSEMVYFVGNATEKTKAIISNQNAKFSHQLPSASQMCELSFEKFKKNKFEDLAYFEPYYLKDFMSTNR